MRSLGLALIQHDSCLHKGEIWTQRQTHLEGKWYEKTWRQGKDDCWQAFGKIKNSLLSTFIYRKCPFFWKKNEWENIYNFAIDNIVQHFKDQFKTTTSCYRSTSLKYHLNLISYHCINSNGPDLALKPAMIHWRECENQMGLFQE